MATDIYMVVTDQRGIQLTGESQRLVFDPYLKKSVASSVEVQTIQNRTENTFAIDSTGSGAGKVVFDPFTITKFVDSISQLTFIAQAQGLIWRFVDIMLVRSADQGGTAGTPYVSYRLGTVGVNQIDLAASSGGDRPVETVSFTYGQLQIGYQMQKPDGTYTAFAPTGWDRVKNVKI